MMSSAELASWILPEHAQEIASAEIFPARWGVLNSLYLWRAPRPAGPPGVCEVDGWGVGFRVENEQSLTPQQSLNPPLRPVWTLPQHRYRVAASTLPSDQRLECNGGQPFWRWAEAPTAEAIHLAARLMEQGQSRATAAGSSRFRLLCMQMTTDEVSGHTADRPCPDARGTLKRLTHDLIKRVRSTQCEGDISRFSEGPCIAVEYHDPAAPGTYSIYMVRLAGSDRPKTIEIVQGMLPPQ